MASKVDACPRAIAVFLYGLFMDVELLRKQGLHPCDVRRAAVEGMALRIGRRATLMPDPKSTALGLVVMLPHADIDTLYADPSVAAYRPEAVLVRLGNGSSIPALCYNLPASPGPSDADADYVRKLVEIGRKAALPDEYLKSLAAAAS